MTRALTPTELRQQERAERLDEDVVVTYQLELDEHDPPLTFRWELSEERMHVTNEYLGGTSEWPVRDPGVVVTPRAAFVEAVGEFLDEEYPPKPEDE